MRLAKHQRQHRIAKLLEAQAVGSQAQLVSLLAAEGVDATQTTVSRDLEELGALKVRLPGGETAYALPELPIQQIAPTDHLRRVLGEWAVEIGASRNMVVLRTPPGCAHVVASALDRSALEGVLGTVAGDDTLLMVVAEGHSARNLAERLESLAGLGSGGSPGTPEGAGAAGEADGADSAGTPGTRHGAGRPSNQTRRTSKTRSTTEEM